MDNYLDLAAQAIEEGEKSRWKACILCAQGVGLYKEGFTKDLAERTGYTPSRISDFAQAGRAWETLKPHMLEAERDRLKSDVFTYCDTLLKTKEPEEVAGALKDILKEAQRPTTTFVKDLLAGQFGIPHKEPDPLPHIKFLETWGETNMQNPTEHAAWLAATRTLRGIVTKGQ